MNKQQRKEDLKTFLTAYKNAAVPICAIAVIIMGILLVNTAADKTAVYALALLFLSAFTLGIEAFITDKQNKQQKTDDKEEEYV